MPRNRLEKINSKFSSIPILFGNFTKLFLYSQVSFTYDDLFLVVKFGYILLSVAKLGKNLTLADLNIQFPVYGRMRVEKMNKTMKDNLQDTTFTKTKKIIYLLKNLLSRFKMSVTLEIQSAISQTFFKIEVNMLRNPCIEA